MILKRLGIDLGTTNVLVCLPKKGIVINEPCVVAIEAPDNKIMAIGAEAKEMLGRTPSSIIASHPLKDGVIANYRITEAMLRYFINKIGGNIRIFRPEIMVAVPAGVTSTERRAVTDACISAGAKSAYIIKEPIAAALGAGIPIATPSGNMVIDIGGGTTDAGVISLGDVVAVTSVRVGGNRMDQSIQNYIRKKYNLTIGEQTAEEIKVKIGSAIPLEKELKTEVSGCNTITGLPETIMISSNDIANGIKDILSEMIDATKSVLQKTPPELAADVIDKGVIMTGGGSLLRKIDELFTKVTGVPCQVAEDPKLCTARGTGIAVENLDAYKKSILWAK
ncbi:MAG: rod shape-determining protein [Candidatus Berkelbacteria bacterium]|nr:rod shape-determining protein [Candidatus Berkelbacteria bacterium]